MQCQLIYSAHLRRRWWCLKSSSCCCSCCCCCCCCCCLCCCWHRPRLMQLQIQLQIERRSRNGACCMFYDRQLQSLEFDFCRPELIVIDRREIKIIRLMTISNYIAINLSPRSAQYGAANLGHRDNIHMVESFDLSDLANSVVRLDKSNIPCQAS